MHAAAAATVNVRSRIARPVAHWCCETCHSRARQTSAARSLARPLARLLALSPRAAASELIDEDYVCTRTARARFSRHVIVTARSPNELTTIASADVRSCSLVVVVVVAAAAAAAASCALLCFCSRRIFLCERLVTWTLVEWRRRRHRRALAFLQDDVAYANFGAQNVSANFPGCGVFATFAFVTNFNDRFCDRKYTPAIRLECKPSISACIPPLQKAASLFVECARFINLDLRSRFLSSPLVCRRWSGIFRHLCLRDSGDSGGGDDDDDDDDGCVIRANAARSRVKLQSSPPLARSERARRRPPVFFRCCSFIWRSDDFALLHRSGGGNVTAAHSIGITVKWRRAANGGGGGGGGGAREL